MYSKPFFQKCKVYWWDGFYVSVRNSVNYHLEEKHLDNNEKELYEKEFGENIIYDTEFYDWLSGIKK